MHIETMKEVLEQIGGATVRKKKNSQLKFQIHLTKTMEETPIEKLNLTETTFNNLKNAGYNTIGQVAYNIHGLDDKAEIMQRLFVFQYYSLDEKKREKYLQDTIELNKKHLS